MATLATIFDKLTLARTADRTPARASETADDFVIRAVANEDVYFFIKQIDNSMVVREADPASGRACWNVIGAGVAATLVLMCIMAPSVYGLLAGYQLEALRHEKQQLETQRAALELQETRLLSPARLDELARSQQFVDPTPDRIVYLEGRDGSRLAKNTPPQDSSTTAVR